MATQTTDIEQLIPQGAGEAMVSYSGREIHLTHLDKVYWPRLGITKGDLLRYYSQVASYLLPHLKDRAMVMKRYPHGVDGEFFFMKRIPVPHPAWIETCAIEHDSGNNIDFPMVQDLASLLWMVNLGCIDLNPWYARYDDIDRPDYLHFDLDPTEGAGFAVVREAALVVHAALDELGMPNYAKTTGSSGIHIYVPIIRSPLQKEVWTFAKHLTTILAKEHAAILTSEYRIKNRPRRHVLVDYNQNAWGRTLASIYSARPKARATVSTPVTWEEIEQGIEMDDFCIDNVPARLQRHGDLWKPLLAAKRGRFDLEKLL